MKRINQFFVIALTVTALSCGKKDKLLIDQLPVEPIVNPETGVLLKNNKLINVQYDGNEIKGFTNTDIFVTNNLFKNFITIPYSFAPAGMTPFLDFEGNKVISSYLPYSTIAPVTYSLQYGLNWKTVTPDIPGYNTTGYFWTQLVDATIFDDNTLLLVTSRSETSIFVPHTVNSAWLYTVNLASGHGELLATIPGYMPMSVHFMNRNKGWMVMNKVVPLGPGYTSHNAYVAATSDGGITWSTPVLVDASNPFKLAASKEGHLFLYNGSEKGYFSADGTTWTSSNSSLFRISDVSIVSASVIYAGGGEGVYKSTNGGLDWAPVPGLVYNAMNVSFTDEQNGIIYNEESLYLTTDGGNSWKTLLYPYPYVMD